MRKAAKAQLAKSLAASVNVSEHGGALLHRVKWGKKMTYKDIAKLYVCHVRGEACIVFDGYEQGPSMNTRGELKKRVLTFS